MIDLKDPQLKRLLSISEQICIEEEALSDMSAMDLENTEKFNNHIQKLLSLLDKESIIINSLSLEKINKFQQILFSNDKHDDTAVAFNRLFQLIQDKLDERENNIPKNINNNDEDNSPKEDIEDDDELETELIEKEPEDIVIPDKFKNEVAILDDYYMDTFNLEKYLPHIIDRISIIVAKKMYQRINNTNAETKLESKYKKKLLKYLKEFKYYIFTLDYKLERLGATHNYNIEAIPNIPEIKEDLTPLYHNQTINMLDSLYSSDISIRKPADILRLLYELMCLEEYIKYLDDKSLNNILAFCEDIEEMIKNPNFGSYGKTRIKERLRKS